MATHIVFVLDRSGSMGTLEADVIGGYNSFLREQKKITNKKATMTTVLFDNEYEILIKMKDLQETPEITSKEYYVRGMTALLDAVGKTINTIKNEVKKKDKVIFIINTDGYENSSHEFKKEDIKRLVKECEDSGKWKFVFFGAGIDAFSEANSIGVFTAVTYTHSGRGTAAAYAAASSNVANIRNNDTFSNDNWTVNEDDTF